MRIQTTVSLLVELDVDATVDDDGCINITSIAPSAASETKEVIRRLDGIKFDDLNLECQRSIEDYIEEYYEDIKLFPNDPWETDPRLARNEARQKNS